MIFDPIAGPAEDLGDSAFPRIAAVQMVLHHVVDGPVECAPNMLARLVLEKLVLGTTAQDALAPDLARDHGAAPGGGSHGVPAD